MPHLQELVKLYQDEPFAVIGVNTGDDPDAYRAGLKKFDVSWISAYQGKAMPIAELYKVSGYPTYFLIDPDGRVVGSGHSGQAFDAPIKRMLAAMKK